MRISIFGRACASEPRRGLPKECQAYCAQEYGWRSSRILLSAPAFDGKVSCDMPLASISRARRGRNSLPSPAPRCMPESLAPSQTCYPDCGGEPSAPKMKNSAAVVEYWLPASHPSQHLNCDRKYGQPHPQRHAAHIPAEVPQNKVHCQQVSAAPNYPQRKEHVADVHFRTAFLRRSPRQLLRSKRRISQPIARRVFRRAAQGSAHGAGVDPNC